LAPWWGCAILVLAVLFFGWVIHEGLQSTSGEVWIRVLIPPYALLLYATLAALVNRRSVVASPDHLVLRNGPIPLGAGNEQVPRSEILFAWYHAILTTGHDDAPSVLWHSYGVETRSGRDLEIFNLLEDQDSTRAAAQKVADALGAPGSTYPVPVRLLGVLRAHPSDYRAVWIWTGATLAAFVIGTVWEVMVRR
jgi:hypothetical protein